jgi:hypothetical protein
MFFFTFLRKNSDMEQAADNGGPITAHVAGMFCQCPQGARKSVRKHGKYNGPCESI